MLTRGQYKLTLPAAGGQEGVFAEALLKHARTLERRNREIELLAEVTANINSGLMLDDVLDRLFDSFREIIPYDRIGFSLLESNGAVVRSYWVKTDYGAIYLGANYAVPVAETSLYTMIQTGEPRIMNDLPLHLERKPGSETTRMLVQEGIQSSLTCPLIAEGTPVGFIFFSSREKNKYLDAHVGLFQQIAGELAMIVEKSRFISQIHEQKTRIEQQNEELKRLDTLKNTFLGTAAHDLRSPLATIQMVAGLLREEWASLSDEMRQEFLKDIGEQAARSKQLLDDLLNISQIESGHLALHPEPVDLEEFFFDIVNRHAMLAAPKGTHVTLEQVAKGIIEVDLQRLRQVLDNLVSNAVKFSPPGSSVRVASLIEKGALCVTISDEGPGIKPEERGKLFKDFVRLSAEPTGGETSTGLGLAIARRIVEAHDGVIGVDSEPGGGATFWFRLPIR